MVGEGSVNHNSRKFKAENVDGERAHFNNIDYCNENIKQALAKQGFKGGSRGEIQSGASGYSPKKNSYYRLNITNSNLHRENEIDKNE